jgi:hypothetical protein
MAPDASSTTALAFIGRRDRQEVGQLRTSQPVPTASGFLHTLTSKMPAKPNLLWLEALTLRRWAAGHQGVQSPGGRFYLL